MSEMLPELPDFCWPVDTSCVADWDAWEVDPDPEAGEPGVPRYTAEAKARAISLAGQTLRMLTGYRVGGCPVTVRPCSRGCREQTWRTYPAGGPGSTPWFPVSLGGTWLNVSCGHGAPCGCTGLREVRLDGPASVVLEVKVDGAVLDPTAYRLDRGGRLVRLDGGTWPLCQDLSLADDAAGTWSVTYLPGAQVDGLGAYVAGVLAGEYVRACTDGECRLPTGVQTIARQGVTMTLGVGAFPEGKTGIREVDAWIERWNPHGLRAPSQVYSPDLRRHRKMRTAGGGYTPVPDTLDGGSA